MAISFIAGGAIGVTPNNATNPMTATGQTIPANTLAGDLILMFAGFDTGSTTSGQSISTPTGWTDMSLSTDTLNQGFLFRVFGRVATGSDSATSPSFAGGSTGTSGATALVKLFTFRGVDLSSFPTSAISASGSGQTFTSQQDIGPILGFTPGGLGRFVLVYGFKKTSWTSVATLSGDEVVVGSWLEFADNSTTNAGDAGLVIDCGGPTLTVGAINDKTFFVTGGVSAISGGRMFALAPASVTVTGDSSQSGSSGLTITGNAVFVGSSSQSGGSGLTATGSLTQSGASSQSGSSGLVADGQRTTFGASSESGSSDLGATASGTFAAASSQSGSSNLVVAGQTTIQGQSNQSSSSGLTVAAVRIALSQSALSGQSSLTGTSAGTTVQNGSASLGGSSALAAAGLRTVFASATLSGSSATTAGSQRTVFASSALSGSGNETGDALAIKNAAASLAGASDTSASGTGVLKAIASLSASSDLAALGGLSLSGSSALSGNSDAAVAAMREASSGAYFFGSSDAATDGLRLALGDASLVGDSAFDAWEGPRPVLDQLGTPRTGYLVARPLAGRVE